LAELWGREADQSLAQIKQHLGQAIDDIEVFIGPRCFLLSFVPGTQYTDVFGFDISARKQCQQQVRELTHFDPHTGLSQRGHFIQQLAQITLQPTPTEITVLVLIDVASFKRYEQIYPPMQLNGLVSQFSHKLNALDLPQLLTARSGPHEFALSWRHAGEPDALDSTLTQIVETLIGDYAFDNDQIQLDLQLGVAQSPNDAQSASELMANASLALSQCLQKPHQPYQFYYAYMQSMAKAKAGLYRELRRAIEAQELRLYYQAQFDLPSMHVRGAESLLRWQHPEHGIILPSKFIPLAEERGLTVILDQWCLEESCKQLTTWHAMGYDRLTLSVNISSLHFSDQSFIDFLKDLLGQYPIRPSALTLEITETTLVHDFTSTRKALNTLRDLGFRIAIDDFGTGYSSLAYLKKLPVDLIKIDKVFIQDLSANPEHANLVDSIIDLAHKLKLSVLAEGVETQEQHNHLQAQACDKVQGFYYKIPLPAEDFLTNVLSKFS